MATPSVSNSTVTTSSDRFTGRVKWFNNKAGYGFITVTDGPKAVSDVFVHHTSVKVDAQQYKYLVQGEYIEFALSTVSNGTHEFQAGDVSGIKGGKLMCETRHELRAVRTNYKSTEQGQDQDQGQGQTQVVRSRGQGPRSQPVTDATTDNTWSQVARPKQQSGTRETTARETGTRETTTRETATRGGRGATTSGRGAGRGATSGRSSGPRAAAKKVTSPVVTSSA